VSGAVIKTSLKFGRLRADFFYVARHYYLTGRPNRLFFDSGGRGSGGVPGGPRGAPGGPRGVPGGVPGAPQPNL
jgi:hypothetical protein